MFKKMKIKMIKKIKDINNTNTSLNIEFNINFIKIKKIEKRLILL